MKNAYYYLANISIFAGILFLFGCGAAVESQFPLPEKVDNFTEEAAGDKVNFQTDLSSGEVYEFYKKAFTAEGLVERELLTVNDGTTVNLVLDGNAKGAIVVQAVALPTGSTNVNIRFEGI